MASSRLASSLKANPIQASIVGVIVAVLGIYIIFFSHAATAPTNVANFNVINYGTALTDSDKYQVMDMQYNGTLQSDGHTKSWHTNQTLHATNPNVKLLVYQEAQQTIDPAFGGSTSDGWTSCPWTSKTINGVVYQGVNANESWFAHDSAGNRLTEKNGRYLMDMGNASYQQACVGYAVALAQADGFDGVFFDDVGWYDFYNWYDAVSGSSAMSSQYPTASTWFGALKSWTAYAGPKVKASNAVSGQPLLAIANVSDYGGSSSQTAADTSGYSQLVGQLDGSMEESWTDGNQGLSQQAPYWPHKLANAAWSASNNKYQLLHSYNSTEAGNTFGLGAMLLVTNGLTSYSTSNTDYGASETWYPEYATAQQLGMPTGSYVVQSSGLYTRSFQKGTVTVNPTTSTIGGLAPTSAVITLNPTGVATDCTIYVSPAGGGNGSSATSPTTISGAYTSQVAGSVVCLRAGTYAASTTRYFDKGGTASSWVTWKAYGDGEPIISAASNFIGDSSYPANAMWAFNTAANYIEVNGLTFDGSGVANAEEAVHTINHTHHHRFINNKIMNMSAAGLATSCTDYFTATGNQIWKFGVGHGWSSGISYNNDCGGTGVAWWADTAAGFHNIIAGNIIAGGFDGSTYKSDGNGIILDLGGNIPPALITNNVVYMNGGRCITALKTSGISYIINNTCYKNDLDTTMPGLGEQVGNIMTNSTWANNIVYAWTGRYTYQLFGTSSIIFNHNSQYGGLGTQNISSTVTSDPNQIRKVDPLFVSAPVVDPTAALQWQNPPAPWALGNALQLQSTSPLVDTGVDPRTLSGLDSTMLTQVNQYVMKDINGVTRPQGSGYDFGAYEAAGAIDTTQPTISVASPANGDVVSGTAVVSASASDNVGVTKVEFYIDGALKSTTAASPYNYSWDTTATSNGTHSLTTKAYDATGNVGTSSPVSVTVSNTVSDTTAPTTSVTTPASGTTVSGNVSLAASASDNVGVTHVDFYVDGSLLASDTTSPYSAIWSAGVVNNGTHTLYTKAYDAAGNVGTSSVVSVTVDNPDTQPPTAPANLTATATSATRVNLSWTASTDNVGVAGYYVQREGVVIATVAGTSYADIAVTGSTTFHYTVVAFDAAGNPSTASTTATVTTPAPPDTTAPAAPTGLVATAASATQVNLTWAASTDTGGSGLAGYRIYRGTTQIGTVSSAATSFGDATAQPATAYSYYVVAYDGAGNVSSQSNTATITTPVIPVANTLNFTPTDDTYVNSRHSNSNYATATTLQTDSSPILDSLMKFSVSGVGSKTVTGAKLRLYVTNGSNLGGNVYRITSTSWTERTVTYNSLPSYDAASILAGLGRVTSGGYVEIDLTSLVSGDGTYGLFIKGNSTDSAGYSSSNATTNKPQLIVTVQ